MKPRMSGPAPRSGVTLTEILISIMILGVGMISLATLFPLGLLRLRDAQRSVRSAYLIESAASEVETRNLFSQTSFLRVDLTYCLSTPSRLAGSTGWFSTRITVAPFCWRASTLMVTVFTSSALRTGVP